MHDAVHEHVRGAQVFIGAAAVADYRPLAVSATKIKKDAERVTLELVRNPDILASVAALKSPPFTVGFAAETEDVERNARAKLERKQVDLIAGNLVGVAGRGFEADENGLLLVDREGATELPVQSKDKLARALIGEVARRLATRMRRTQESA
jgi:phosphopantothenoylcysteine decarboxylase/phosphopantothenate--cysteine ligase